MQEVLMLITGHKKKTLKITSKVLLLTVFVMSMFTACSKEGISIKNNTSIPSKDGIEVTEPSRESDKEVDKQIKSSSLEEVDSANFVKSSLQYGYYLNLDGKIITSISSGMMFNDNALNDKYPFYKSIGEYLGLDGYFKTNKIFTYNDRLIYIIERKDANSHLFGEILSQDIVSKKIKSIKLNSLGSRSYYILGNRVYFDEYDTNDFNKNKYFIRYVNLDTLEQKTVCVYDEDFHTAKFVLRKDGAVAYAVNDSNGISQIFRYNNNLIEKIFEKRWCSLVDYDNRGVFYTAPSNSEQELSNFKHSFNVNEFEFILQPDNGEQKVLLKRKGEQAQVFWSEIMLFDKFFLFINSYSGGYVEKYNYEGVLSEKIKLKEWPSLDKKVVTDSEVIYSDRAILNVFFRQDTNELEVQKINLE